MQILDSLLSMQNESALFAGFERSIEYTFFFAIILISNIFFTPEAKLIIIIVINTLKRSRSSSFRSFFYVDACHCFCFSFCSLNFQVQQIANVYTQRRNKCFNCFSCWRSLHCLKIFDYLFLCLAVFSIPQQKKIWI